MKGGRDGEKGENGKREGGRKGRLEERGREGGRESGTESVGYHLLYD